MLLIIIQQTIAFYIDFLRIFSPQVKKSHIPISLYKNLLMIYQQQYYAMTESINSSPLRNNCKDDRNYQSKQSCDDLMPFPPGTIPYNFRLPSHTNNKILALKNLKSRSKIGEKNVLNLKMAKKMYQSLDSQKLKQVIQESNWGSIFNARQSKPNIYNMKFNRLSLQKYPRKAKDYHALRNLNRSGLNATSKQFANSRKQTDQYLKKYMQKQFEKDTNPQIEPVWNNIFAPRLNHIDYSRKNQEIMYRYFLKLKNTAQYHEEQNQISSLSEVSHLQQLEHLRQYLKQCQSKKNHAFMPKIKQFSFLKKKADKKNQQKVQNESKSPLGQLRKKREKGEANRNRYGSGGWQAEIEDYHSFNTIDVMQNFPPK